MCFFVCVCVHMHTLVRVVEIHASECGCGHICGGQKRHWVSSSAAPSLTSLSQGLSTELEHVFSGWLEAGRAQSSSFPHPTRCCSDKRAHDHTLLVQWAHSSELQSFLCRKFPEPLDQVSRPFTGFLKLKKNPWYMY